MISDISEFVIVNRVLDGTGAEAGVVDPSGTVEGHGASLAVEVEEVMEMYLP